MIEVLEPVERDARLVDRLAFIWTRSQWCARPAQVPLIIDKKAESVDCQDVSSQQKQRQLCNMANITYCAAEVAQLYQTRHSLQAR